MQPPPARTVRYSRTRRRPKEHPNREPWKFLPKIEGDCWANVMTGIDRYDDEAVRGWRGDIDTLLVFAGLFSAVVTAFVIESYQWFSEDPGDKTARLIAQLSQHIGTPNISSGDQKPFSVESRTIRINILWFLSLVLALSAASGGILAKQWLREYRRDPPGISNRERLSHRQLRDQGWGIWKVEEIISALPIILEIALVLFFVGVMELLWSLNRVVALSVTVVIALTVLFLIAATVLPAFYMCRQFRNEAERRGWKIGWDNLNPCPYKSAQSLLFARLAWLCLAPRLKLPNVDMYNWPSVDAWILKDPDPSRDDERSVVRWTDTYLKRGMRWVVLNLGGTLPMVKNIIHCMNSLPDGLRQSNLATWDLIKSFSGVQEMAGFHTEILVPLIDSENGPKEPHFFLALRSALAGFEFLKHPTFATRVSSAIDGYIASLISRSGSDPICHPRKISALMAVLDILLILENHAPVLIATICFLINSNIKSPEALEVKECIASIAEGLDDFQSSCAFPDPCRDLTIWAELHWKAVLGMSDRVHKESDESDRGRTWIGIKSGIRKRCKLRPDFFDFNETQNMFITSRADILVPGDGISGSNNNAMPADLNPGESGISVLPTVSGDETVSQIAPEVAIEPTAISNSENLAGPLHSHVDSKLETSSLSLGDTGGPREYIETSGLARISEVPQEGILRCDQITDVTTPLSTSRRESIGQSVSVEDSTSLGTRAKILEDRPVPQLDSDIAGSTISPDPPDSQIHDFSDTSRSSGSPRDSAPPNITGFKHPLDDVV
ncbi:hypothetical protein C8J56DRAFT_838238 [Mycena floridula]|nr:hypothetical protein C8J56DRAFT_838238 [Mycena floridula]